MLEVQLGAAPAALDGVQSPDLDAGDAHLSPGPSDCADGTMTRTS